ncbi:hypothetical protein GGD65_006334 [Bradyrhizobium sp. CIR18]|nr:hypothetical protein [Bradyrhizobium sp. CIR18]
MIIAQRGCAVKCRKETHRLVCWVIPRVVDTHLSKLQQDI